MSPPLIEAIDLFFAYPHRPPVLKGASFVLEQGERVGLVGANGSGKSTFLQLLVGLHRPQKGILRIFGQPRTTEKDFEEVRRRVGLVFQDPDDQLFSPTVLEDIAFGPLNLGTPPPEAHAIATRVLREVGLEGVEDRITDKLSGGEKRLVALATVLAMEPEVLLLDEPVAGLDRDATSRIRDVLARLPHAMVLVSHDDALLSDLETRRITLDDGKLLPSPSS